VHAMQSGEGDTSSGEGGISITILQHSAASSDSSYSYSKNGRKKIERATINQ